MEETNCIEDLEDALENIRHERQTSESEVIGCHGEEARHEKQDSSNWCNTRSAHRQPASTSGPADPSRGTRCPITDRVTCCPITAGVTLHAPGGPPPVHIGQSCGK